MLNRRDHPRARGEYGVEAWHSCGAIGSPPSARGIHRHQGPDSAGAGITPERAGNTPAHRMRRYGNGDHPRARGEYQAKSAAAGRLVGSPPSARGIQHQWCVDGTYHGITPERAGNTAANGLARSPIRDHPRARGEYGNVTPFRLNQPGSPPSARGIRYHQRLAEGGQRITPERAGNTFLFFSAFHTWSGSPPSARGIPPRTAPSRPCGGITPERAGNTPSSRRTISPARDHPRARGEYTVNHQTRRRHRGSPPSARGIPDRMAPQIANVGITPERAGNTVVVETYSQRVEDHPRARGEYQYQAYLGWPTQGSPPSARGIPLRTRRRPADGRITPERAGNTTSGASTWAASTDHPRARGEYWRHR